MASYAVQSWVIASNINDTATFSLSSIMNERIEEATAFYVKSPTSSNFMDVLDTGWY